MNAIDCTGAPTALGGKTIHGLASVLAVASVAVLLMGAPPAVADADPCPDVGVVFARGTDEDPGAGGVGQAFAEALHAKVGAKTVGVYPVDYPASSDFGGGTQFAMQVVVGVRDASSTILALAASCPATKIVLGGWSQGAAVVSYTTSAEALPFDVPPAFVPAPLPLEIAPNHVAAVALFGKPSKLFLDGIDLPPITSGPLYVPKTIDQCAPGDTVCNGEEPGEPTEAHNSYDTNGMVDQAAQFAASRL